MCFEPSPCSQLAGIHRGMFDEKARLVSYWQLLLPVTLEAVSHRTQISAGIDHLGPTGLQLTFLFAAWKQSDMYAFGVVIPPR